MEPGKPSKEFQTALDLIRKLREALSQADANRQNINADLIQSATDFLDKHGGDRPTFSG
jgi:hypothetical protein